MQTEVTLSAQSLSTVISQYVEVVFVNSSHNVTSFSTDVVGNEDADGTVTNEATTTTNVMDQSAAITQLRGHFTKNLDLKLLHSSMQTSADHRSGQRHVSRMTDEKGETWGASRENLDKNIQASTKFALYAVLAMTQYGSLALIYFKIYSN